MTMPNRPGSPPLPKSSSNVQGGAREKKSPAPPEPTAPARKTARAQSAVRGEPAPPPQVRRTAPSRSPLRQGKALASRGEHILFWFLLAMVLMMSFFLIRMRNRTAAHFLARAQTVPLTSATGATASVMLTLANDTTGALVERPLAFPLPADSNTRARVVLEKLLAEYTAPGSAHPLQPGPPGTESIHEVFLTHAPGMRGLLAVVDLTEHFVHSHPSGIEPESLTILSIIATLHANLPQVAEVRFLVDGEPRATLAGHAALDQTFLAGATEMTPGEAFTSSARP